MSHVPEEPAGFSVSNCTENLSLGAYTPRARAGMKQALEEQLALFPRLAERMSSWQELFPVASSRWWPLPAA